LPHTFPTLAGKPGGKGGKPAPYRQGKTGVALYDLDADVGETTNVADQHSQVVQRLQMLAEKARADLGDSATRCEGKGVRPPGTIEEERTTEAQRTQRQNNTEKTKESPKEETKPGPRR
jgi:hypothetical protein